MYATFVVCCHCSVTSNVFLLNYWLMGLHQWSVFLHRHSEFLLPSAMVPFLWFFAKYNILSFLYYFYFLTCRFRKSSEQEVRRNAIVYACSVLNILWVGTSGRCLRQDTVLDGAEPIWTGMVVPGHPWFFSLSVALRTKHLYVLGIVVMQLHSWF